MRSVLLVEDEAQQRDLLAAVLESCGYLVSSTASAEDGLEQYTRQRPDLVVTDVKLVGMDGFTMFEEMRKLPSYDAVPVIFITAYNDPRAIERVKNLGAAAYVTKPYDVEDLVATVKKHLPPGA
jgi:CheY-like chemotaxis protein